MRTLLAIASFVLSLATGAAAADPPKPLAERIAEHIAKAPQAVHGAVGIEVMNLADGKSLFSYNEQQLFLPASNMKLFTGAVVLSRLGPDYRFETRLIREASGALVLLGSGDPTMSSRVYPYSPDARPLPPLHAIDALVEQAIANGLQRVDGNVIGDDRRYEWSPYPESWTADDALHDYGAPVSALALDDNFVRIRLRAGSAVGDAARVELEPAFEYFTIDNRVRTVATGGSARLIRIPGTRQVVLEGTISARSGVVEQSIAVDDPALFVAHALYDALLRRGIPVRGRPVARHRTSGGAEVEGDQLAIRTSPPLSEILRTMLKVSQNLHAEMLLREVGFAASQRGTVAGGLAQVEAMLRRLGIPAEDWRSEDGSGLARNDQVAPRAVVRLLQSMDAGEHGSLWRTLLPRGGEDGTLSNRLCCTVEPVSILAKTGSLNRAVALSGYAESPANGRLAFSILVNNFSEAQSGVRAWVDRLAGILVE